LLFLFAWVCLVEEKKEVAKIKRLQGERDAFFSLYCFFLHDTIIAI